MQSSPNLCRVAARHIFEVQVPLPEAGLFCLWYIEMFQMICLWNAFDFKMSLCLACLVCGLFHSELIAKSAKTMFFPFKMLFEYYINIVISFFWQPCPLQSIFPSTMWSLLIQNPFVDLDDYVILGNLSILVSYFDKSLQLIIIHLKEKIISTTAWTLEQPSQVPRREVGNLTNHSLPWYHSDSTAHILCTKQGTIDWWVGVLDMHFNTQLIILFEPIRSHLDIIDVEDLKVIF